MSASQYRGELERKRSQRVGAERKASTYRARESKKRAAAAEARVAASKIKSASNANSKLREAERYEREAATAGKEAERWQYKASQYAKQEQALQGKVANAERAEAAAVARERKQEQKQAGRRAATGKAAIGHGVEPLQVFVARSHSDTQSERVLKTLRTRFVVVDSILIASDLQPPLATRAAMAEADVVVVVLPRPGNRDRSNVIFEAGIAVGRGLPIVIVSDDSKLPRGLLGIPFLEVTALSSLTKIVTNAAKTGTTMYPHRADKDERESIREAASEASWPRESAEVDALMSEAEVLDLLQDKLIEHGVKVLRPEARPDEAPTDRADLVVWDDNLMHMFGLPLPMEVIRDARLTQNLRSSLRHTLRTSGARSLVAVAAGGTSSSRWADGHELILSVPAMDLLALIDEVPLHVALASLLERASVG